MGSYNSLLTIQTAISAIAVLGFYLTLSSGQLSIAQGAFFAIGAYTSGWVMIHENAPLIVGILAGMAAAGVASILVFPAVRLRGLYFAVATFAFGSAVAAAVVHISAIGGAFGLLGVPLSTTLFITLVVFGVFFVAVQLLEHSPLHAALTAARDDPEVAETLGIRVTRLRFIMLVLGAVLAGAAGALYASAVGVVTSDNASFNVSLSFLLMAVVGGSRSAWGVVLGAIIWTVAPELLRFANNAYVIQILFGCLAIGVMAFRPEGLLDRGDFGRIWRFITRRGERRDIGLDSGGSSNAPAHNDVRNDSDIAPALSADAE